MAKIQIIYIRGLGDNLAIGQQIAVALWRAYAVEPHFFAHKWSGPEMYEAKQERLLKLIDTLHEKSGQPVGLIGSSAGASLALNAYAERKDKVKGVVSICGKILRPETLDPERMKKNLAFYDSMKRVENSLKQLSREDRTKIRSVYSSGDRMVRPQDSIIDGAHNVLTGSTGHARTILLQITLGAKANLDFLKQL